MDKGMSGRPKDPLKMGVAFFLFCVAGSALALIGGYSVESVELIGCGAASLLITYGLHAKIARGQEKR